MTQHGELAELLEAGDKPLLNTRLHWIYLMSGIVWFWGWFALGAALYYFLENYGGTGRHEGFDFMPPVILGVYLGSPAVWILGMLLTTGLVVFLVDYIKYLNTRIILTQRQVIYKTGLINIKVDETDIEDIQAAHVNQGILGHILGYGRIHLDCRFVDDIYLPAVRKPYELVHALHAARSKIAHGVTFNATPAVAAAPAAPPAAPPGQA